MMKEYSMHILDIVQNSIRAGATKTEITVRYDTRENIFAFSVADNGCGMDKEMLEKVRSPFTTSRTTRRVGLGIPMLEQTASQCGGGLELVSEPGVGTTIGVTMQMNSIDLPPMGDLAGAIYLTVVTNPELDFVFRYIYNDSEYVLDTAELKEVLEGVPLNTPDIMLWIDDNIKTGITETQGGSA